MEYIASTFAPGSLEAECPGGLDWAWNALGECVRSTRDKVSIAFGVASIICWFLFGFPQMVLNCRKKIPDQAVSPYLLFFWTLGDSTNLIGAFLTNQLFLQKVLAAYTVVIEILLIIQLFYYRIKRNRKKKEMASGDMDFDEIVKDDGDDDVGNAGRDDLSQKERRLASLYVGMLSVSAFLAFSFYSSSFPVFSSENPEQTATAPLPGVRRLFQTTDSQPPNPWGNFLVTTDEKVGYALGWIGCSCYYISRGPQIFKNFRRKTTDGLSPYLFMLTVCGSLFYGLQILVKSLEPVFVVTALPWIIGSIGTLLLDAIIFVQFFLYRKNVIDQTLKKQDEEWSAAGFSGEEAN